MIFGSRRQSGDADLSIFMGGYAVITATHAACIKDQLPKAAAGNDCIIWNRSDIISGCNRICDADGGKDHSCLCTCGLLVDRITAAVKIVPEKFRSFAMSMVVTGTSIAMIFGLPLGRIVGLYVGWRMTFFCVAVVAFLALIYMAFVFPKVEGGTSFKMKELPMILKNPVMLGIILMSFLVAGAYYTGYSYIEPF